MLRFKDDMYTMLNLNNMNTYVLQKKYKVSSGVTTRISKNEPSANSIDILCRLLDCQPADILEYVPDKQPRKRYSYATVQR